MRRCAEQESTQSCRADGHRGFMVNRVRESAEFGPFPSCLGSTRACQRAGRPEATESTAAWLSDRVVASTRRHCAGTGGDRFGSEWLSSLCLIFTARRRRRLWTSFRSCDRQQRIDRPAERDRTITIRRRSQGHVGPRSSAWLQMCKVQRLRRPPVAGHSRGPMPCPVIPGHVQRGAWSANRSRPPGSPTTWW